MTQAMTVKSLYYQNLAYAGTPGISRLGNRCGFMPGFLDRETGRVYVSRRADGTPAPVHVFDGLPEDLVVTRTGSGQVAAIKGTVIAGFILEGQFYTREQAAMMLE